MEIDMNIVYILLGIGGMLGLIIGMFVFDTYRRVGLMRQLLKKNYGIVNLVTRGRSMYPLIKNFSSDIIRTNKGIWILHKGSIYRQTNIESSESQKFSINKKDYSGELHHEMNPREIDFRSGVPVVNLDIEDMIPLKLVNENIATKDPITRNPYQVEATLSKEIAAAELEAIKMTKKNMQLLLMIIAILVFISIGVSAMGYMNTEKIGAMVQTINGTLAPHVAPVLVK